MIRQHVNTRRKEQKDKIVWRCHEVTRVEALSDAVFAFSLTLLIVALEVPKSFSDLLYGMTNFLPFGLCFWLIFYIWQEQYVFFRRYGLHDTRTISLNGVLMLTILFFVYPLKFLSNLLMQGVLVNWLKLDIRQEHIVNMAPEKTPLLMIIYSSGFTAIFVLFVLMYYNAYKKRLELNLTDSEIYLTKTEIYGHVVMASFGVVSILLAMIGTPLTCAISGFIYCGIAIPMSILHARRGKIHRLRFEQFGEVSNETPEVVEEFNKVKNEN